MQIEQPNGDKKLIQSIVLPLPNIHIPDKPGQTISVVLKIENLAINTGSGSASNGGDGKPSLLGRLAEALVKKIENYLKVD